MILSAEHVRLIRIGKKTEHRTRIIEPVRRASGEHPGFGNRPHVGEVVPISVRQRIDGKTVAVPQCTVIVTDYHRALLADSLNVQAVRAEGHKTTDAYKAWWVREHDRPWVNAYVIRHELEPDDGMLLERFEHRHTNTLVWVTVYRPDPVSPERYIARDGRGDEHGYTTRPEMAVRHIPPAVDEATQRRLSDQGREFDRRRAMGVDEELLAGLRSVETQRREFVRLAGARGINVRDEVRMLDRAQAGLERKIRQQRDNRAA